MILITIGGWYTNSINSTNNACSSRFRNRFRSRNTKFVESEFFFTIMIFYSVAFIKTNQRPQCTFIYGAWRLHYDSRDFYLVILFFYKPNRSLAFHQFMKAAG
ncbi:unnamed protein product [Albugo candida]|uniref:Uncharacterized protein n=1 Tax=Albugo candida TaxID=65357 RepID=A0A024GDS6_9STRA|nr:unnamed protein product [Albugo candida]|eukprot:CCI44844.1 unnamed protein product [Albugo candida]